MAMSSQAPQGAGSVISVRAYTRSRNGRIEHVDPYQRSNPGGGGDDDATVEPIMARRPTAGDDARGKLPPLSGGGGGSPPSAGGPRSTPPANTTAPSGASPLPANPSSYSLPELLMPNGRPIGTVVRGAHPSVRTMPGGDQGARNLFQGLIEGRGGIEVTPPGHIGRIVRLPDGSFIGYRPTSRSGIPSVDVRIPEFGQIKKIHFID